MAEAAFGRLTTDQQLIARGVFLRLVARGNEAVPVRRPAALAEFDADGDSDSARVLDVLTDNRLLTANEGSIEIAHEVLLHDWPRLPNGWMTMPREGAYGST